jgi:hypothetical protein
MSETEKVEKKEKKEKKVMTPERLEQLARARKKALEIRQAGAAIKEEQKEMADAALEEKLERERQLNDAVKKSLIPNAVDHSLLPVPRYTNTIVPNIQPLGKVEPNERVWDASHEEEEEEQPVIIKKKTKKPPKTKVIIEQSSDDEDEFQSNDHVIFVKRKSKNDSIKKVPATTPVPPNTPEPYYAPPPTPRKPQPEFTNFVDLMANNGGFINRRNYY